MKVMNLVLLTNPSHGSKFVGSVRGGHPGILRHVRRGVVGQPEDGPRDGPVERLRLHRLQLGGGHTRNARTGTCHQGQEGCRQEGGVETGTTIEHFDQKLI